MNPFQYITDSHATIQNYASTNQIEHNVLELTKVRTEAFKLQAFARLIKRAGKKSSDEGQIVRTLGNNLKASSKFIEDSIGELLHHFEMNAHTKSNKRLEEAKLRFTLVRSDFSQHVDWISKSLEVLNHLDLRALYIKGLVKELKKLEEKCDQINPELLEDGTHELRRSLRWAVMYIIYPKGLFKYSEETVKTDQYTELSHVEGIMPFELSFEHVDFLSQSVRRLGEAKDEGLIQNYSKTLSEINSSQPHIIKLTRDILESIKKDKVFTKMRTVFKEQI